LRIFITYGTEFCEHISGVLFDCEGHSSTTAYFWSGIFFKVDRCRKTTK